MPTIVIRLDPAALADPNADLRYQIPDLLEARTDGLLRDDGYDYERDTDAMLIFLKTEHPGAASDAVAAFLASSTELLGQDLSGATQAGASEADPADVRECLLFFPPEKVGVTLTLPASRPPSHSVH